MNPQFDGTGYLLTASVAAVGGYAVAAMRYAPRIAELAQRVDSAERGLHGQGQAIDELSEALRSLLGALEGNGRTATREQAVSAARRALVRRSGDGG